MKNTPNEAPDAIALSVVTVVRNDAAGLERTMASVAEQTRPGIEYIVVDGASTDGTLEAIRRRADLVDAWISEPDGGIYAAMNKGAAMASGDYVLFMNAGDRFYAAETVEKIFEPRPRTELLWGDCVIEKSGGGEEYDCARDVLRHLHRQMTVSHQSSSPAAPPSSRGPTTSPCASRRTTTFSASACSPGPRGSIAPCP